MRTVYLLRHAKSSWEDPTLADHDRPLAPRGRKAAPRMGAYLRREGLVPNLVLSSTALRARQTWELVAPSLPPDIRVEFRKEIYGTDPVELLGILRTSPDDAGTVMLIGHNPALEDCAARLAGAGDPAALKRMASKYPTAALAEIAFDADRWSVIEPGTGRLTRFVRPKDLD
ncbi:SixA phosphatase family protein [Ferruginivarius sediminum]|uniref:SixA phosphatase family protein n=1 Tax=Ferruginivarius sediminum TaxID=2661937 RepID=UPI001F4EC798|nr:histidine phosphatase family protein [Ferruginivarius sediminum]